MDRSDEPDDFVTYRLDISLIVGLLGIFGLLVYSGYLVWRIVS